VKGVLVVVPCGKAKVWDQNPGAGPTRAEVAYLGAPFAVNKQYARCFGETWVILSAKYGFIRPDFLIPGTYNVRFGRGASETVSPETLRGQVMGLLGHSHFCHVIALGGKDYRKVTECALDGLSVQLHFPFRRLSMFKAMAETKRAVITGDPGVRVCCQPE
jgi:hypothetical protein